MIDHIQNRTTFIQQRFSTLTEVVEINTKLSALVGLSKEKF